MRPIFVLDRVCKRGGEKRCSSLILNNVSFAMPPKCSIGVLGARGQGKTTLINLIAGAIKPDTGNFLKYSSISFPVAMQGIIRQDFFVSENIRFMTKLYGVPYKDTEDFICTFGGLGDFLNTKVGSINSAKRAALLFSLSYAIRFDCYISDGSLVGGDDEFREICMRIVAERRQHSSFLFATRSPRDIRLFADVAAVIEQGSIRFFYDIDSAIDAFRQSYRSHRVEESSADNIVDEDAEF